MKLLQKKFFLFLHAICLVWTLMTGITACGLSPHQGFTSLTDKQPMVLEVFPPSGSVLTRPIRFVLTFSQRIDLSQVGSDSITLISGTLSSKLQADTKELVDQIQEEDLPLLSLNYSLAGDERTLTLHPQEPLEDGLYHLVVTPLLFSVKGLPFNQEPGKSPMPFIASYGLGQQVPLGSNTEGLESLSQDYGPFPDFLIINEILYDGLHSETDGEAFIELYGTPYSDISDFEIALINGANGDETDLIKIPEGSKIPEDGLFVIGDLKTNSTQETQVEEADYLDQFDPQNGPDGVHLMNREGNIMDSLWYGEGAVSTTLDGIPLGEGAPAEDVSGGISLSRMDGLDTDDNSLDFTPLTEPTPGRL